MERTEAARARGEELSRAGRLFFERGWVPATAGNFSARLDERHVLITASGRAKGELGPEDFLVVNQENEVWPAGGLPPGGRPSAETALHLRRYQSGPHVGAVLHTHSLAATVLSRLSPAGVVLEGYEVLKALPGVGSHTARLEVPVFGDRKSTRLNSSHSGEARMPSSA